jgi:hypothetical protein
MQRNNNSTKLNNNKSGYKTFCKVCQDSGKTEKEYTNHNVRDLKDGRTTCPTLLSQECRNCYRKGHTMKFCTLTKALTAPNKKPYEEPVKTNKSKSKNVFMIFDDDSETEPESDEKQKFPALNQPHQQLKAEPLNYGRLISITEQQVKKEEFVKAVLKAEIKETPLPKLVYQSQKGKLNWATAESDSEGDEEEEDYYPSKKSQQEEDTSAW